MIQANPHLSGSSARKPVLDVVDRVSEMLFGLFMALSFVGAISAATEGAGEIRTLVWAALGCNLAWGITDAFMYLVSTLSNRGNLLQLVHAVRNTPDVERGCKIIHDYLEPGLTSIITPVETAAIRERILALPDVPQRPRVKRDDVAAAFGVFFIVVASTFPVALPYVLLTDVVAAMVISRVIALVMLFMGGFYLGRYSGYNSWLSGFGMMGLGIVLVLSIMALGG